MYIHNLSLSFYTAHLSKVQKVDLRTISRGNQPAGIHLRGLPTLTAAVDRVAVDRVAPVDRVAEGEDQADLGNRNQNYKKINLKSKSEMPFR